MNIMLWKGDNIVRNLKVPYQKEDTTLKFSFDEMEHTLNLETLEFTRENEEYIFYLDIKDEKCEITLKNEGYYLQVPVEYANLLKNKKIYELSYRIETDDEPLTLRIELEREEA